MQWRVMKGISVSMGKKGIRNYILPTVLYASVECGTVIMKTCGGNERGKPEPWKVNVVCQNGEFNKDVWESWYVWNCRGCGVYEYWSVVRQGNECAESTGIGKIGDTSAAAIPFDI